MTRHVRRAAFTVALILALGLGRAKAQDDDEFSNVRYGAPVVLADIEAFVRMNGLSAEQRSAALSLLEDYDRAYLGAGNKRSRYEEFISGGDIQSLWTNPELQAKVKSTTEAWQKHVDQLKERLYDDLVALAPDEAGTHMEWLRRRERCRRAAGGMGWTGGHLADLVHAADLAAGDGPLPIGVAEVLEKFEREAALLGDEYNREWEENAAEWKRLNADPAAPEGSRRDLEVKANTAYISRIQRSLRLSWEYRCRLRPLYAPEVWFRIDDAFVEALLRDSVADSLLTHIESKGGLTKEQTAAIEQIRGRRAAERRTLVVQTVESYIQTPLEEIAKKNASSIDWPLDELLQRQQGQLPSLLCPVLTEAQRELLEGHCDRSIERPVPPDFEAPPVEGESVIKRDRHDSVVQPDVREADMRDLAAAAKLTNEEKGSLNDLYKGYCEQFMVAANRDRQFRTAVSAWRDSGHEEDLEVRQMPLDAIGRYGKKRSALRAELRESVAHLLGPERERVLVRLERRERRNMGMGVWGGPMVCGAIDLARLVDDVLGDEAKPEPLSVVLERYESELDPSTRAIVAWKERGDAMLTEWTAERQAREREAYRTAWRERYAELGPVAEQLGRVSRSFASQIAAALTEDQRDAFEQRYYFEGVPGLTEDSRLRTRDFTVPKPRGLREDVERIGVLTPVQRASLDAAVAKFLKEEIEWNKKILARMCEIEAEPNAQETLQREQWSGPLATLLSDRGAMGKVWVEKMMSVLTDEQVARLPAQHRRLRPVTPPVFEE